MAFICYLLLLIYYRLDNEWSLLNDASPTKRIKMSSLSPKQRGLISHEILKNNGNNIISETEATATEDSCQRKGRRKTKAPQARSSALS